MICIGREFFLSGLYTVRLYVLASTTLLLHLAFSMDYSRASVLLTCETHS